MASSEDLRFMELALQQARLAAEAGEIPVGAVVVKNGVVIGAGHNQPINSTDPTAHAEICALRQAALKLGNYRLDGCTLYVTLEPCSMCSGAILQARLERLVFGAAEPKTGAAGSLLNLFERTELNHQTRVEGGVLAQPCAAVLQGFFLEKRRSQRAIASPLRDDALRTPESAFPPSPWPVHASHYVDHLPTLGGLRLHFLEVGAPTSAPLFFCIHGQGAWSYQFEPLIAAASSQGYRVIAPDLIGFGKSDKPKRAAVHSPAFHWQILLELLELLDVSKAVLVVAGAVGAWGLDLLSLAPGRFSGLLACDVSDRGGHGGDSAAITTAFLAPFPDKGHQAALQALPRCLPLTDETRHALQSNKHGPTVLLRQGAAPLVGVEALQVLLQLVPAKPTSICKSVQPGQAGICAQDVAASWAAWAGR